MLNRNLFCCGCSVLGLIFSVINFGGLNRGTLDEAGFGNPDPDEAILDALDDTGFPNEDDMLETDSLDVTDSDVLSEFNFDTCERKPTLPEMKI